MSFHRIGIVGVDPGKNTGVAVGTFHPERMGGTLPLLTQNATNSLEVEDVIPYVKGCINRHREDPGRTIYVAAESFVRTGSQPQTNQPDAERLLGALRTLCQEEEVQFLTHMPSTSKKAGNNSVLRSIGWWVPGRENRHINDASRQVIATLLTQHPEYLGALLFRS